MIIGCFALIEPFRPLERQFEAIRELGIDYADLTDNHDGAALGQEFQFSATASLDALPSDLKAISEKHGITLTSLCAHANLLDPTSPARYGTAQIIKAIRLAHLLGLRQVITTEGDPKTDFGHRLTPEQRIFSICEKLYEPIRWAEELGIQLLLEPHGVVSDSIDDLGIVLDRLGHEKTVGLNLDTGNLWLGGGDPLQFIRRFGPRITHVHWKDMGEDWLTRRGKMFGCGMGDLPLGDGIVGIEEICKSLLDRGFDGPTTLEIAGRDNVLRSVERLRAWAA